MRAVWWRSRPAVLALAGFYVCCGLPGGDVIGDDRAEWLNSVYVVTIWDLILLGIALAAAWSAAREHGAALRA